MTSFRLVVLRHGQSEWNAAGIFTGWENAYLTATGEEEATRAGELLAEQGVYPAFVHTSLQRRTIRTADLALAAADRDWIPVRRSWRLNGRHYGALQGRNKAQVLAEYGEQQFMGWRRSYDATPPPLSTLRSATPATRLSRPRPGPGRSPSGRSPRGCCLTGTTRSCRTCWPAAACSSSRTATRCGHWSKIGR